MFQHEPLHWMQSDWRWAGDLAAAHNQVVLVEPWDDDRVGFWLFEFFGHMVWNTSHPRVRLVFDTQQLVDINPYFVEQRFRRAEELREEFHRGHPDGSHQEAVAFLWRKRFSGCQNLFGHVELHTLNERPLLSTVAGLVHSGYEGMIGLRGGITGPLDQFVANCRRTSSRDTGAPA